VKKPGPTFTVIDGGPEPETPKTRRLARIKAATPAVLVRCPRCTSNMMMQVRLGMFWSNGKPVGGNKQIICADCHGRGEYVPVGI